MKKLTVREKSQLKWGYFFIGPAIIGLFRFNFAQCCSAWGIQFCKRWDV
ncbi:MAG: hypothetical protein ACLTSZ_14245 [Lachnospiraceae bacterium]